MKRWPPESLSLYVPLFSNLKMAPPMLLSLILIATSQRPLLCVASSSVFHQPSRRRVDMRAWSSSRSKLMIHHKGDAPSCSCRLTANNKKNDGSMQIGGHRRQRRRATTIASAAFLHHHSIKPIRKRAYYHHHHLSPPQSPTSTQLSMSLIPVPVNELQDILPTPSKLTPTGDQYVTYLGRTPRQRFNSLFEGVSIAFLGSMFAYFISFVIGQFMATILGVIFIFWPILSPEFKAYQRNWELVGGRDLVDVWMDSDDDDGGYYYDILPEDKRGLYGGYYVSQIEDVCVVDDVRASSDEEYDLDEFNGYTMATDELEGVTGLPWKLRLRLLDDEGRGMQVHSRMSEEYLDLRPGMHAVGVLLSTSKQFGELAAMTDFCILDDDDGEACAWVGDYPYLEKDTFLRILNENGIANDLLDEQYDDEEEEYDDDDDVIDEDEDMKDEDKDEAEKEEYITVR